MSYLEEKRVRWERKASRDWSSDTQEKGLSTKEMYRETDGSAGVTRWYKKAHHIARGNRL